MKIFSIFLLLFGLANVAEARGRVYCDRYVDANVVGYSIYNKRGYDIGTSVFTQRHPCFESARVANASRQGIVCSPYSKNGISGFSIYRIRDRRDLGTSVFKSLRKCNRAVETAMDRLFCAPYSERRTGKRGYSVYSVRTGQDMGRTIYSSLESCNRYLRR